MVEATFHFPRGFMWGSATASHQVEGYNRNNNWWEWEQEPGHILNDETSGAACDWWGGRWRDDLNRAKDGGQNAHRFSVEWSRIQPLPDKWDESNLERYREIVRYLSELGMTPMVTLHHFSDPIWFSEMGGWEKEENIQYFIPYVRKVIEALQEYTNLWVTINEPNVLSVSAYLFGVFPPGKKDLNTSLKVMSNLAKAHALAYHTIHEIQKEARVGLAINYRGFIPTRAWSPLDQLVANLQSSIFNDLYPKACQDGILCLPFSKKKVANLSGTQDFLGINYYTQDMIAFQPLAAKELFSKRYFPEGPDISENGFIANFPKGIFKAIEWGRQFNLPLIITENGVEDSTDELRPRYIIEHIHQVWRAVNFNYPVKGYFHWTLVDNFEWDRGWSQRFGLWELDINTQERIKRQSADLYADICHENGISSEMVARYAPQIFESMFPS